MIYDIQKASIWKRASAFLFDIIILAVVAVAFVLLFSAMFGYDGCVEQYQTIRTDYEEEFSIKFDKSDYENLTESDKELYDARYEQAEKELASNRDFVYLTKWMLSLSLLMVTFGILLAYIVLEFVIPLIFKNGQTLGKKIFGICVVRNDCVRMSTVSLFIRTFLGKFAVETMIPVLIFIMLYFGIIGIDGLIIIGILLVAQIVLMIVTKTNSVIHDVLSYTVVADYNSQMIFESEEKLASYKAQIAADEAARQQY